MTLVWPHNYMIARDSFKTRVPSKEGWIAHKQDFSTVLLHQGMGEHLSLSSNLYKSFIDVDMCLSEVAQLQYANRNIV